MRRILIAAAACLALTPASANAVGPGGWENLGGGVADTVNAVNTDLTGQVLVGGRDLNAGGNANADHLAGWNGTGWVQYGSATALGSAAQAVHDIAVANGKIYVGGGFKVANGAAADSLAVWDTTAGSPSWQPFCATTLSGSAVIDALEVVGNTLYVGGSFDDANGNPLADNLVECDLGTGTLTATQGDNGDLAGRVQALAADSAGDLYVGGTFIGVDSDDQPGNANTTNYVVKNTGGTNWVPMPDSMGNSAFDTANVDALGTSGTDVYVGGDDTDIAGLPDADSVAKWDGASWSAVGPAYFPAGAAIGDILVNNATVYATGAWNNAAGDPFGDGIAVFNGGLWEPLGTDGAAQGPLGPNGSGDGNDLALLKGSVVVGGAFTDAGGDALADRVACFGPCPNPANTGGGGNGGQQTTPPPPPKRCKKGQKLKKGKCVKRKRKRKK